MLLILLTQKDTDCTIFKEVKGAATPNLILYQLHQYKTVLVLLKQKVSKRIDAVNEVPLTLREQLRKPKMERAT